MKYLLLSYPRSGNTWTRYFIEYISGKPTLGYDVNFKNFDSSLLYNTNKDPIAIKRHSYEDVGHNGLILCLRNPKECIPRHCGYNHSEIRVNLKEIPNVGMDIVDGYFYNLRKYDEYNGPKHIVYYEDIIGECTGFYQLAEFLGYDVGNFFDDLESHKDICIKKYGSSTTKGKAAIYHSEKMDCSFMNEIILQSDLGQKYLSRYI